MKHIVIIGILVFSTLFTFSQEFGADQPVLDSLDRLIKSKKAHDTTKTNAMSELAEILYFYNQDTILTLAEREQKFIDSIIPKHKDSTVLSTLFKNLANALNNQAIYYGDHGNTEDALTFYFKSLEIHKKTQDPEGKGSVLNNIAITFENQGDVTRALDYYNQSLLIRERSGDLPGEAITLYNIAYIYSNQNENDQALNYFHKSLEIENELDSDVGRAYCYNSIAEVYIKLEELVLAKSYLDSAFVLRKKIEDAVGLAQTYENYADINLIEKEYALALQNFKKALEIRKDNGETRDYCFNLYNTGLTYLKVKKVDSAIAYAQRTEKLANELGYPASLRNTAHLYSLIYEYDDQPEKALRYFKKYIWLRDSLQNAETQRAAIQRETQYNYERKLTEDSIRYENQALIHDAMIDKQKAELKARRNEQYLLFGGLSLSVVFGLFVFNRFRVTRKQNKIIDMQRETSEMQRKVVEEKNREITDSINYAKRIQEAILPPKQVLSENLVDGFVLFRPKDVVSGDFYWLEKANGYIFFAAADCTGHGVPGAMVSVICSNALTKCVVEEGLYKTGEILDRTREIVIEQLNKSGEMVNDGMDISLVAMKEKDRMLEKTEIMWSGANNGMWIIRSKNNSLDVIKPDKQPIGSHSHAKKFTTHIVSIERGDQLYLFSDGFADQFGGEHFSHIPEGGKKYKSKRFKDFLLSVKDMPMDEQREELSSEFDNWKGDLEQIDDVCVIGVRF